AFNAQAEYRNQYLPFNLAAPYLAGDSKRLIELSGRRAMQPEKRPVIKKRFTDDMLSLAPCLCKQTGLLRKDASKTVCGQKEYEQKGVEQAHRSVFFCERSMKSKS